MNIATPSHALGVPSHSVMRGGAPAVEPLVGRDTDFDALLKQARRDGDITRAARTLTAQALILPILKELRSGSMAWGPFKAGDAEKSFGPMLDTELADRMAASPRLPVASAIEARLRVRERGVG